MAKNAEKVQKEVKEQQVKVDRLPLQEVVVTIYGISPLLMKPFTEKCQQQVEDCQSKTKKTRTTEKRDYDAEYEDLLNGCRISGVNGNSVYGIPASGLKKCGVRMGSLMWQQDKKNYAGTYLKSSFQVVAVDGGTSGGLLPIEGSEPVMDFMWGRLPGPKKVPIKIVRPRWDEWQCTFKILYNRNMITPEDLMNLYENAGFSVGLCEFRPEKDGNFGMFSVRK
jgi:hypothetical protein